MFQPELISQVEIVVPEQYVLATTRTVARAGIFHQVDASHLSTKTELHAQEDWQQQATAFAGLERRLWMLIITLEMDVVVPSGDLPELLELDALQSSIEKLETEVQHEVNLLNAKQKELEQCRSYIQQLTPMINITIDIDVLRNPQHVFSILGIIPNNHIERLHTSLAHAPHVLLPLSQDPQRTIILLSGMKQDADILQRAARSAYINPLNLPKDYHGMPREIITELEKQVEQLQEQIAQEQETLTMLRIQRTEQIQTLLWQAQASRMLSETLARYGRRHYVYIILGWVPKSELAKLRQEIATISESILVDVSPTEPRVGTQRHVPTALKNPGLVRTFEPLVTTYSRPRYGEIDPTLFLALTFPLLFGTMFGDVGHGLVLLVLGLLIASSAASRTIPKLSSMAPLGSIIAICGGASMVFGFLYGSIFGLEHVLPALWIRPMENIMQILGVTVIAGVILICVGFLSGIFNAWTAHDWKRLWFGHTGVSRFLLYCSLIGLVIQVFVPQFPIPAPVIIGLTIITSLAVMFSDLFGRLLDGQRPLIEGNIIMYGVQIFFEFFETVISLLSNSLSFVRVGAFAVAHGGLSAVIFILAGMIGPGHGIVYWIVVALGNLFIIGFEGMIVGIQTLRLEYYEFFSKFFTGGGMPYTPLAIAAHKQAQNES